MRTSSSLVAVVYDKGFLIDDFMTSIATKLRADGFRIGGVFQENACDGASPCSAMTLVDLRTGERFGISQNLGPIARGCRLDPRGLLEAGMRLDAAMHDGVDLLLLNKFGKGEAEGGGLRSTFAGAIETGVPVLTAVRPPYLEAWTAFHGGLAADLMPDLGEVLAWCRAAVQTRDAAPRSVLTAY